MRTGLPWILMMVLLALSALMAVPPVYALGDTCSDPIVVNGLPFTDTNCTAIYGDNYDAVCPFEGSTAPDVVYRFTAPETLLLDVVLCNDDTNFDTKLYIYDGDCVDGTHVACNDDFCRTTGMAWAYVSILQQVSLTMGHTYYIIVDGHRWSSGNYVLDLLESSGDPQTPDPDE